MTKQKNQIRVLDPVIESPSQDKQLGKLDLAEELELALSKVREEYRTCFILFHRQELSITRVAEIMKCPKEQSKPGYIAFGVNWRNT